MKTINAFRRMGLRLLITFQVCLSPMQRAATLLTACVISQFLAEPAMALTLGQMGTNGARNVHGLGFMAWMIALLVGFSLVIIGIIKFAQHRQNKEGVYGPLMLILCGALACASPKIIDMVQTSFLGTSSAQSTMSQLNIGS